MTLFYAGLFYILSSGCFGRAMPAVIDRIKQWSVIIILAIPITIYYAILRTLLFCKIVALYFTRPTELRLGSFLNSRVIELKNLSSDEELDFKWNRSPSYCKQLAFGSLWELSKLFGNQQTVPLVPDSVLYDVIINSVFCQGLIKGDGDIAWRFPFHIKHHKVYDGFYWDVDEIYLHRDKSMSIRDRSGVIHTNQSKSWKLAKAHVQVQLTFFGPGLSHDHIHFVFPSIMSSQIRSKLPVTSVLRQLLVPHTRFTLYINYMALHVCNSSKNSGSLSDRIFRPWLSFPICNDDFIGGVARKCEEFYYENNLLIPDMKPDLKYHQFLRSYYDVIHEFVEQLSPLFKDDYVILESTFIRYLPSLKNRTMVDVITALIWKSGVMHFCDHFTYLERYAMTYGCMSMRIPLTNGFVGDIKEEDLFKHEDIYHTRCFLNCFVKYNPTRDLDLSLPTTTYDFHHDLAIASSHRFMTKLKDLDANLRKNNKGIVPLSKIVRSVCF